MLKIELCTPNNPLYERAYDFAKQKYLLPRMNMKIYYRPTVLFGAINCTGEIIGVMGVNIGFVSNEMLVKDERIKNYTSRKDMCDQSIFALDDSKISLAPYALSAAVIVYTKFMNMKYLGVLAIEVSRKIMARMKIETPKLPDKKYGFGKPDKNLLPPEHRNDYDTWLEYNDPISIEIIDLDQAVPPCREYLMNFHRSKKVCFDPVFEKIVFSTT